MNAATDASTPPSVADSPPSHSLAVRIQRTAPKAAAWSLPFILIVYLGLEGGGYGEIVRDEVGIAVWWIVLLGAVVGVLPIGGLRRDAWIGVGLLAGFTAWTGLGIAWSESSEASVIEFARVATFLGVFVLVVSMRQPGDMRRIVNGLAAGMAVVGVVALLSRLHPSWFSSEETGAVLAGAKNRLSYPLNYWNGLAALMAMAIPLLLAAAIQARTMAARAAAAAALPAVALTAFFTLSRGGAIEIAVGVAVFMLLAPRRIAALLSLLVGAVGAAILVVAASDRQALTDGLATEQAHHQGDEMLVMTLIVCAVVALIQVAIGLAARSGAGPRVVVPKRPAAMVAAGAATLALVLAIATGLPGYLGDRWQDFKTPQGAGSGISRFDSATGSGRYQTWSSAVDANASDPLIGIGPGEFESWWARNGDLPVFVRDAHSLYLETLGELGIVGLFLIGGFVVFVLAGGTRRSLRRNAQRRWPYAAATASAAAFAVAAGIDWAWELSVLPIAFLILAGGLFASRKNELPSPQHGLIARSGLIGLSVIAVAVIAPPLLAAESVRSSQTDARSGDLEGALDAAKHAHDLQPYAATPLLQEALVLELMRSYDAAASAARDATRADSDNWRPWLVLSRLENERGKPKASVSAYRRARMLNPRSPIFPPPETTAKHP